MQQRTRKRGRKGTPAAAFQQHGKATTAASLLYKLTGLCWHTIANTTNQYLTEGGRTSMNSSGRPCPQTTLRAAPLALLLCRGAAHSVTAMQSFVEVDGPGGQHEEEGGDHEADDGCEGQHNHHLGEGDLGPPGGRVLHRPRWRTRGGGVQGGRLTEAGQRQVAVLPRANAGSRIHNGGCMGWRPA